MGNNIDYKSADNLRILALSMVEKAKSGHPGGAMGGADFVHILYSEFLNWDPSDLKWAHRDRFFLDPGHMSPMLYGILTLTGSFSLAEIENFRQWGSPTPGHPEVDIAKGVENTSGPLGQGHTMAVGAAIAEKFLENKFGDWMAHNIFTFISDGGIQEEIAQGAGRIAGHLKLNNLVMFYDSNQVQLSTKTNAVTTEDTAKKYEAWGWKVIEIDGNDHDQIRKALKESIAEKERPSLIIGNTIMGKGCLDENGNSFEGQVSTHGQPLSSAGASVQKTIENLGGDPDNPFSILPEVKEFYTKVLENKKSIAQERKAKEKEWASDNPQQAALLRSFLSGEAPAIEFEKITQKLNSATRGASAVVLSYFAEQVENMIVSSADLSNSDKTDGFLKKTEAMIPGNLGGQFLQAGVCELTMAALMNGMSLHGGVIPACGTFLVFSDYMKPAARLSALMELPVKYIWTHDAFRVGEDGPTHQPIEHEAQLRLLEQLKNHSGRPGMLVLRPADADETTVAWKLAMENTKTPTALLLSRQNITSLPAKPGSTRFADALEAQKGAYIAYEPDANPDVILVANGSEVATCFEGMELLKKEGINARIVSAISEGLFRQQSAEYQQSVISDNVPVFGLTAGLPATLAGLVGNGKVFGLDHFGYSAPYTVLDEKFGFTGENVKKQVLAILK